MNLYVWEDVSGLTTRYHDGGGLLIIARDLTTARSMIDRAECEAHTKEPDYTAEISAAEPRIFVFENAGCC